MRKNTILKIIIIICVLLIIALSLLNMTGVFPKNVKNEEIITNNKNNIGTMKKEEKSFSEMMDFLYPTFGEKQKYYPHVEEEIFWEPYDGSGYMICNSSASIYGADLYIYDSYLKEYDYEGGRKDIKGIAGEIVDIEIIEYTDSARPKEIYFLTREGNVYCLDVESIKSEELVAKQMSDLKEVVSIKKVGVPVEEEHDAMAAIAIKYDGETVYLSNI